MAALRWLVERYGYEATGAGVWAAYSCTMNAAKAAETADETRSRIRELAGGKRSGLSSEFFTGVLGLQLDRP